MWCTGKKCRTAWYETTALTSPVAGMQDGKFGHQSHVISIGFFGVLGSTYLRRGIPLFHVVSTSYPVHHLHFSPVSSMTVPQPPTRFSFFQTYDRCVSTLLWSLRTTSQSFSCNMYSTRDKVIREGTLGYLVRSIAITLLIVCNAAHLKETLRCQSGNRVFTPPTFHHASQLIASFGSGRHKNEIPLQGTVRC